MKTENNLCRVLSLGRIFCKGDLCGEHLRDINERDLLLLYKDRFIPDNPLFGATLDSYKIMEDYIFKSIHLGDEAVINFRNKNFDLFYKEDSFHQEDSFYQKENPKKLYLMLDSSYVNYPVIKIGISKDPSKRLISLRGSNKKTNSWQNKKSGSNLKLVCTFDDLGGLDEAILHNLFSHKRLLRPDGLQRTEYFSLDYDDIEYIIHYAGLFGAKPHWFRNDLKQILSVDFKCPNFKSKNNDSKDKAYRAKHLKPFLNRSEKRKGERKPKTKSQAKVKPTIDPNEKISIKSKDGLHVFEGGYYDGEFVNPKSTSGPFCIHKHTYLKTIKKEGLAKNARTRRLIEHYLKFKKQKKITLEHYIIR